MMWRIPAPAHLLAAAILSLAPATASAGLSPCDLEPPSDASVEWACRTIGKGESLEGLFGARWVDVARFNRIDRRHAIPGTRIKVPLRLEDIECFSPMPERFALGAADSQSVLVDLSEQFLGAYEKGRRVFSAPIAGGRDDDPTPRGVFQITAYDRDHHSSIYRIANTRRPYPMHFGLRFHVDAMGVSFWIHGRDLPGVPASHGCVGLYDEAMQHECYGRPGEPVLADARWLFDWVAGPHADTTGVHPLESGPRVWIIGSPPGTKRVGARPRTARSGRGAADRCGIASGSGTRNGGLTIRPWQGDCMANSREPGARACGCEDRPDPTSEADRPTGA